jgi:tetratricopeptide (TPR) repeat protein
MFLKPGIDEAGSVWRFLVTVLAASVCLAQPDTAEQLIRSGHWKRARVLVERRLAEAPGDADAYYLLSMVRNAFGDHASPLSLVEKAVRLDNGVARYHRQLAEVQGVMAQHAGILQQISLARRFRNEIGTALQLDPRDVQAQRDLLEFYLVAPGILGGDTKKAEQVAQRIAEIDATEGLLAQARIAEFGRNIGRAEALLGQAAEVRPPSYKAQMALAELCLSKACRKEDAAEQAGKAAIQLDAGRVGGWSVLSTVYAARADWSALDAILASSTRAVPDDATPYYRAAERLLLDGREPARAERYLRVYLAQEPEGNQPTVTDARRQLGLALKLAAPAQKH